MAINIIIGDDHPIILKGLSLYLNEKPNLNVLAVCKTHFEILKQCSNLKPDILILDISMPVYNGIETAKKVLEKNPSIHILFYSITKNKSEIYNCYSVGGKGFISKDRELEEVETAIHKVYHNQLYFDSPFTTKDYESFREFSKYKINSEELSFRHKEILSSIARGMSNKEMSEQLSLSIRSVENNRRQIRIKLGIKTNTELIKFALEKHG